MLVQNEKGLTLVEVTATLVLTVILLSSLIFLLNQTSQGINKVSSRESIIQESRVILDHVVASARRGGFVASRPDDHSLLLAGPNNQYFLYSLDSSSNTLNLSYQLENENEVLADSATVAKLSEHVRSFSYELSGNMIDLTVVMSLNNNQTYSSSTVVNMLASG